MRVLLKLELDCHPDDAWRAIRSPQVFQDVSYPLTQFTSLEAGGFPDLWEPGDHPVKVSAFGKFAIGEQLIAVSFAKAPGDVRIVRDHGRGLSGPLALVNRWEHSMAISAAPGGKTLYRDQLSFSAGLLTPVMWLMYWTFWQFRAAALKRLAPTWGWGTTRRTDVSL
ncbi:hypothetical protein ADILRU_1172 [Leifsonia rubra CMS 76R]|uniref:Uncharacterized protein n=1 Tax=Rhodoglobus vestalii TaxID=193384 RepID=A0A8H2K804_9MICO|nr:hypothetical protein [Rhodoglobus vestalii]EPR76407.1 hypothetical protein ADILRU_1172 [Leifsonia rubra CMS 76R]TQO20374.1 hypothetical protein FB472_2006 [Rhodoglobus vestalii]